MLSRVILCFLINWLSVGLLIFFSCAALAEPSLTNEEVSLSQKFADDLAQRARAAAQNLEREIQKNAPTVSLQSAQAAIDSKEIPIDIQCFPIKQVIFVLPDQVLPSVRNHYNPANGQGPILFLVKQAQPYAHRCIGKEGLNHLLKNLNQSLVEEGYTTTKLGLGAQDLSNGTIQLSLIPGVVGQIVAKNASSDKTLWGTIKNAFPAKTGTIFNLRDLEQGLEQLKRLTYQEVEMDIVPTPLVGVSDIVLSLKRTKPWRLSLTLDDSGGRTTGKLQAGANATFENPLGVSDILTLGLNHDANQQADQYGTRGNSLSYQMPYGYWLYGISLNRSHYYQTVVGHASSFVSSGDSSSWEAKASWLFQRDQIQKNSVQLRLGHKVSSSYIDDTEIEVQRRKTSFVELAWIHKRYFGEAQLDLTLAHKQGVPWFDAQDDLVGVGSTTTPGSPNPTFFYRLQTLDVSYAMPLSPKENFAKYNTLLRLQHTTSSLYASEWFSIGNRYSVRGFDGEETLSAEKGAYWRNEMEFNLPWQGHTFFTAFDLGRVWGSNTQYLVGAALVGTAIGWRGALFKGNQFEVFMGLPVVAPSGFKTANPCYGFNLSYQF